MSHTPSVVSAVNNSLAFSSCTARHTDKNANKGANVKTEEDNKGTIALRPPTRRIEIEVPPTPPEHATNRQARRFRKGWNLQVAVVRARNPQKGEPSACDLSEIVGTLNEVNEIRAAIGHVLHALPNFLDEEVHVPELRERVVDGKVDLLLVLQQSLPTNRRVSNYEIARRLPCAIVTRQTRNGTQCVDRHAVSIKTTEELVRTCASSKRVVGVFPVTVDSIIASPAATTPALKFTFGSNPKTSFRVERYCSRSTTLLTQWSGKLRKKYQNRCTGRLATSKGHGVQKLLANPQERTTQQHV